MQFLWCCNNNDSHKATAPRNSRLCVGVCCVKLALNVAVGSRNNLVPRRLGHQFSHAVSVHNGEHVVACRRANLVQLLPVVEPGPTCFATQLQ